AVSGWATTISAEVQRDVTQKKILRYLNPEWIEKIIMSSGSADSPEQGVIDTIFVRSALGGVSQLTFKSYEQGREKFQGASLDFVWFDEEPPRDIYYECLMRVMDRVGDLFGTMTPLKGLTWVYDDVYLNPKGDEEIWTESMEWSDNPFLPVEEIERLSVTLDGEDAESRRYGRFMSNGGLVYPEFDSSVHVIEPFTLPKEWQSGISIDPGLSNPLSCHFYYEDYDGNIYVAYEHYEKGKSVDHHAKKIIEIAKEIGWRFRSDGRLDALIDSASNQRTLSSEKSVAELFYERGIAVNTKVNKDVFSGISKVRELFQSRPPRVYIFKNCVNFIREIKGYSWGNNDSPIKRDDHAMDEFRYYVMANIPTPEPAKPKNKLLAHKERLVRERNRRKRNG
ncbi:MAG: terminase family protein, partial [Clostridia bacterium]|nr:terminase family protein [Clostridia bacterium]